MSDPVANAQLELACRLGLLEELVEAAKSDVDTIVLQKALTEGVVLRVNKAVSDVEMVVGSSSTKIQQAKNLVGKGLALLQQENYVDALASFYKALQKVSGAK